MLKDSEIPAAFGVSTTFPRVTGLALQYHRVILKYADAFCKKHNLELSGFLDEYSVSFLASGQIFNLREVRIDIDYDAPPEMFWKWYNNPEHEKMDYLAFLISEMI